MSSAAIEKLLTAEEFGELPDDGRPKELVRGRVLILNIPFPRHGQIAAQIVHILGSHLDRHDTGHLLCNNSGVIIERGPDTVRGADVAYYSYDRVPRGPIPPLRYLPVMPELVFEVPCAFDRWPYVITKVGEYLGAGISYVAVLDDLRQALHLFQPDEAPQILSAEQEFALPTVLGDFRVRVERFFE